MKPTKNEIHISNLRKEISSLEEKIAEYTRIIEEKKQLLAVREASQQRYLAQLSNKAAKEKNSNEEITKPEAESSEENGSKSE